MLFLDGRCTKFRRLRFLAPFDDLRLITAGIITALVEVFYYQIVYGYSETYNYEFNLSKIQALGTCSGCALS